MDIRHPLKEIDIDMIGLCRDFDVEFLPVLTKSDKVSNNQIFKFKARGSKENWCERSPRNLSFKRSRN